MLNNSEQDILQCGNKLISALWWTNYVIMCLCLYYDPYIKKIFRIIIESNGIINKKTYYNKLYKAVYFINMLVWV